MHPGQPDPGDSIILQHVHIIWKVFHGFNESKQHLFWTSWNTALGALQKARYRWQVVSGPLQALQAYLMDLDFDVSNGQRWKRTGYGGIPDCILSLNDPWPLMHHKLIQEFRWQRLLRLTRYDGCHDLERPLDWMISLHIQRTTSEAIATGLRWCGTHLHPPVMAVLLLERESERSFDRMGQSTRSRHRSGAMATWLCPKHLL